MMVVIGFVTYSLEALNFVNDPINVIHQTYRPYFLYARDLYFAICIVTIVYLAYCFLQISLNYSDICFRNKIFFLFSIYFIFTINLCWLKSHAERKHIYFFPKWRKSPSCYNHKQLICFHASAFLHAESERNHWFAK